MTLNWLASAWLLLCDACLPEMFCPSPLSLTLLHIPPGGHRFPALDNPGAGPQMFAE